MNLGLFSCNTCAVLLTNGEGTSHYVIKKERARTKALILKGAVQSKLGEQELLPRTGIYILSFQLEIIRFQGLEPTNWTTGLRYWAPFTTRAALR